MRTCEDCRLCCKVFPLPVLGKAGDEWCRFAGASGCSIHDRGQPAVCREYACYWLEHEEMPEEFRPDRIGVVVTERGTVRVGDQQLPVWLFNQSHPGACRGRKARALIDQAVASGVAALVLYGPEMQVVYDRARYPSVSPTDIEVALRYAQSQDAEELKRLGAVPEDYRPLTWAEAEELVRD